MKKIFIILALATLAVGCGCEEGKDTYKKTYSIDAVKIYNDGNQINYWGSVDSISFTKDTSGLGLNYVYRDGEICGSWQNSKFAVATFDYNYDND